MLSEQASLGKQFARRCLTFSSGVSFLHQTIRVYFWPPALLGAGGISCAELRESEM